MSIRRLFILTRYCFFRFLYVSLVFLGCDSNFFQTPLESPLAAAIEALLAPILVVHAVDVEL